MKARNEDLEKAQEAIEDLFNQMCKPYVRK